MLSRSLAPSFSHSLFFFFFPLMSSFGVYFFVSKIVSAVKTHMHDSVFSFDKKKITLTLFLTSDAVRLCLFFNAMTKFSIRKIPSYEHRSLVPKIA